MGEEQEYFSLNLGSLFYPPPHGITILFPKFQGLAGMLGLWEAETVLRLVGTPTPGVVTISTAERVDCGVTEEEYGGLGGIWLPGTGPAGIGLVGTSLAGSSLAGRMLEVC